MHWAIMPLLRYAEFHGRSTRREYWAFQVLYTVVIIGLLLAYEIGDSVTPDGESSLSANLTLGAAVLFAFGTIVPQVSAAVRRLHDQNRSGWFYLLAFIPYLGGLILIVLMFLGGTDGPNRFGDDPREDEAPEWPF